MHPVIDDLAVDVHAAACGYEQASGLVRWSPGIEPNGGARTTRQHGHNPLVGDLLAHGTRTVNQQGSIVRRASGAAAKSATVGCWEERPVREAEGPGIPADQFLPGHFTPLTTPVGQRRRQDIHGTPWNAGILGTHDSAPDTSWNKQTSTAQVIFWIESVPDVTALHLNQWDACDPLCEWMFGIG
jgi:hypothetical protein